MKCSNCGKEIAPGNKFCTGCGKPIAGDDRPPANAGSKPAMNNIDDRPKTSLGGSFVGSLSTGAPAKGDSAPADDRPSIKMPHFDVKAGAGAGAGGISAALAKRMSMLIIIAVIVIVAVVGVGIIKQVNNARNSGAGTVQTAQSQSSKPSTSSKNSSSSSSSADSESDSTKSDSSESSADSSDSSDEGAGNEGTVWKQLAANKYMLSAGAGGWLTTMTVSSDGKFSGTYTVSEFNATSTGSSQMSTTETSYEGRFTSLSKNSDGSYTAQCSSYSAPTNGKPGETYTMVADGSKVTVGDTVHGMESCDTFTIYMPGYPTSKLPKDVYNWGMGSGFLSDADASSLTSPIIVNTGADEAPFFVDKWNH